MIISCENIPESEFDIDFVIKIFAEAKKEDLLWDSLCMKS